jgi:hypothetical protein
MASSGYITGESAVVLDRGQHGLASVLKIEQSALNCFDESERIAQIVAASIANKNVLLQAGLVIRWQFLHNIRFQSILGQMSGQGDVLRHDWQHFFLLTLTSVEKIG